MATNVSYSDDVVSPDWLRYTSGGETTAPGLTDYQSKWIMQNIFGVKPRTVVDGQELTFYEVGASPGALSSLTRVVAQNMWRRIAASGNTDTDVFRQLSRLLSEPAPPAVPYAQRMEQQTAEYVAKSSRGTGIQPTQFEDLTAAQRSAMDELRAADPEEFSRRYASQLPEDVDLFPARTREFATRDPLTGEQLTALDDPMQRWGSKVDVLYGDISKPGSYRYSETGYGRVPQGVSKQGSWEPVDLKAPSDRAFFEEFIVDREGRDLLSFFGLLKPGEELSPLLQQVRQMDDLELINFFEKNFTKSGMLKTSKKRSPEGGTAGAQLLSRMTTPAQPALDVEIMTPRVSGQAETISQREKSMRAALQASEAGQQRPVDLLELKRRAAGLSETDWIRATSYGEPIEEVVSVADEIGRPLESWLKQLSPADRAWAEDKLDMMFKQSVVSGVSDEKAIVRAYEDIQSTYKRALASGEPVGPYMQPLQGFDAVESAWNPVLARELSDVNRQWQQKLWGRFYQKRDLKARIESRDVFKEQATRIYSERILLAESQQEGRQLSVDALRKMYNSYARASRNSQITPKPYSNWVADQARQVAQRVPAPIREREWTESLAQAQRPVYPEGSAMLPNTVTRPIADTNESRLALRDPADVLGQQQRGTQWAQRNVERMNDPESYLAKSMAREKANRMLVEE